MISRVQAIAIVGAVCLTPFVNNDRTVPSKDKMESLVNMSRKYAEDLQRSKVFCIGSAFEECSMCHKPSGSLRIYRKGSRISVYSSAGLTRLSYEEK